MYVCVSERERERERGERESYLPCGQGVVAVDVGDQGDVARLTHRHGRLLQHVAVVVSWIAPASARAPDIKRRGTAWAAGARRGQGNRHSLLRRDCPVRGVLPNALRR